MIRAADLLAYEAVLREAKDGDAFVRAIVDLTPSLFGADRVLAFRRRRGKWRLEASSQVSSIEPDAPAVRALEALPDDAGGMTFVIAVDRRARPLARIAIVRPALLDPSERALLDRLTVVWSHGYLSHGARPAQAALPPLVQAGAVAALVAVAMLPVRLTALAPYEIVARDPIVLAAPMDGVVESVAVAPDAPVRAGTPIALMDARELGSDLSLAQRKLELAEARLATAAKDAFRSDRSSPDVILARAERRIARAERDLSAERRDRAVILAPKGGIVLHAGRDHWSGRPVRAGERIAEIADPKAVRARIELAIADGLVIREGASVELFPDGTLERLGGRIERASYLPEPTADDRLIYPLDARLDATPRIGSRGTARVEGEVVRLWYKLLRRPIAALRQRTGW